MHQTNSGLAAARNTGIKFASGDLILFVDDDVVPTPKFLESHLACHLDYPASNIAVMGCLVWSPEVDPTPFMVWYGNKILFAFSALAKLGKPPDFRFWYFNNTSMKRKFLLGHDAWFDESFRGYGFEDTEFAYRLEKMGLRFVYNPAAVGHHYKKVAFADACHRAQLVAEAWKVFEQTEAGKYVADLDEQWTLTPRGRLSKWQTRYLGLPFSVLGPLLDSKIPLPSPVYRILYNYHTRQFQRNMVKGRQERRGQRHT